jgi:hypothetical protein
MTSSNNSIWGQVRTHIIPSDCWWIIPFSFGSIILGIKHLEKDAMVAGFVYMIIAVIVLAIKYRSYSTSKEIAGT